MINRVDLNPPISSGFRCTFCGQPIVAVAELQDGPVALDWTRTYDWRHEAGLSRNCSAPQRATPFNPTTAGRTVRKLIEESIQ